MATRVRLKDELLYEQDFYVWTEVQADLLRARRFDALDLENLIEEIEALGRAEKKEVLSHAAVIVEQMLKLQYSPAARPRRGRRSGRAARYLSLCRRSDHRRLVAVRGRSVHPRAIAKDVRARSRVGRNQRLENWKLRRALRRPYFLRSTRRELRVR